MNRTGYWKYLIQKQQWGDWLLVVLCTLLGGLLIRYFYPWPALVNDSYDYLQMALEREFNPIRPFGYPLFLRLLGVFSHAPGAILAAQGIVYALSAALLFLAVKKYWPPRRVWLFRMTEALAVLSPAALYMLNAVLSDALFCSLVFILLAMCIVMVKDRSWTALGVYLLAFYAALFVRHSAEFFPLAFIPVFIVHGKPLMRILSSVLTIGVLVLFCMQMRSLMYQSTGYRQVSTGFEGWQLANNAIHVLPHVDSLSAAELPQNEETAFIHQYLWKQYDGYINRATGDGTHVSADFMWDPNGPLRQVHRYCVAAYDKPSLSIWVDLGTHSFKDYGIWLMTRYPKEFIRYYLWPNAKSAFFPYSPEAVFTYIPSHPGERFTTGWFGVDKDLVMKPRSDRLAKLVQPVLSWIELLTWLVFLGGGLVFLLFGREAPRDSRRVLLLLFLFGLVYYGTTVFASPVALRYWLPMHAVKLSFAWMAVRCSDLERLRSWFYGVAWLNKIVPARAVRTATVVFVSLPLLAFFVGFLRWYYALAAAAALAATLYFVLKPEVCAGKTPFHSFTWRTILIAFALALVWTYFGGMNGYWFQTSDWDCRNALYFDLIRKPWPVLYEANGGALVYYIGHWLPPAALARALFLISGSAEAGLMAGRMLLWLWSAAGVTLVMLLLCRVLGAMSRRQKCFAVLLLILFSGMDVLGAVLEGTLGTMMLPLARPSGPHLEWWMQFRYQFSSNTTLLYWVFNQTITAWLATLLFLQDQSPRNYVFYGVGCLFCAPFATVGLAVLMVVKAVAYSIGRIREPLHVLKEIFSPQNLLSLAFLLLPVAAYLLSANAVGGETASVGGREDIAFFSSEYLLNGKFLLFILLEVGAYLLLIAADHYKNPLYYALWASFLIFPYFHIGRSLDFPMRATIPALFVLMVYAGQFLLAHFKDRGWKKVCTCVLALCLLIGTATPAVEIYRGFYYTGTKKTVKLEDRSLMSFDSDKPNYNFVTPDPQEHFFFKYLAKQNKPSEQPLEQ